LKENELKDPKAIFPGQTLVIPDIEEEDRIMVEFSADPILVAKPKEEAVVRKPAPKRKPVRKRVGSWIVKGTVKLRKKANKTPKIAKEGTITIDGQKIQIKADGTFEAEIRNNGQNYLKVEGTDIKKYKVKKDFYFEVSSTEKQAYPASLEVILDKE